MAKKCEICGKVGLYGSSVSHAHNVSRRKWQPNLQRVKVKIEGQIRKIYICTRCLRSGKVEKV